jgi:hypothetical protein
LTDLRKDMGVRPEALRGFYGSREGVRPRPSRAPLAGTTRVQGGWWAFASHHIPLQWRQKLCPCVWQQVRPIWCARETPQRVRCVTSCLWS